MLDLNKEYWENRAKEKGHTGWSDPIIYSYDQKIRLNTIEFMLQLLSIRGGSALDYGCGTGDFSVLLSKFFDKVKATDLSDNVIEIAKNKNYRKNIEYLRLNYDSIFKNEYNLILSITVLQHILNDNDLLKLLKNFSKSIKNNGVIILLESFSDNDKENINNYIINRTEEHFFNLVTCTGLKVSYSYNFYDPYKLNKNFNSIFFRILRKLVLFNIPFSRVALEFLMKKLTNNKNGIVDYNNKTKILILTK